MGNKYNGYLKEIRGLRYRISKIRQRQSWLEKRLMGIGVQMPGSVVWKQTYQPKKLKKEIKQFAYLSYSWEGMTRYRYIRKEELEKAGVWTTHYREFNKTVLQIQKLNRALVELYRHIQKVQISRSRWNEIRRRKWERRKKVT